MRTLRLRTPVCIDRVGEWNIHRLAPGNGVTTRACDRVTHRASQTRLSPTLETQLCKRGFNSTDPLDVLRADCSLSRSEACNGLTVPVASRLGARASRTSHGRLALRS